MTDKLRVFQFRPGKRKVSPIYLMSAYLRIWAGYYLMWEKITWFVDSPATGNPACLCSYCLEVIKDESCAIRLFHSDNLEARFHVTCFLESGLRIFIIRNLEERCILGNF